METTSATAQHSVSAIVPVYNVERYLEQCLKSIRSALGQKLQIIIVNDGSTDSSPAIAERFVHAAAGRAADDPLTPDFRILTKPNGGYGSAVNAGIAVADGAYIGIVEPDDYLDGDLFGELFAIAERTGMPDIVKSTYKRVWMPDTPEQRIWGSLLRHRGVRTWQHGTTNLGESPQLVRWHPSVWSAIYRRGFLDATSTRFLEIPGGGWVDNPFVMRAMCQASTIAFTDDAWYCYREDRPGSSTVLKAPDLSLTRWLQMADEVAASRWAHDAGVQRSLASIAFRYVSALWDTDAWNNERVHGLGLRVLNALDTDTVLALDDISPAAKQRFLAETQRDGVVGGNLGYRLTMLRELFWSWRENGLFFTCERAGLHKRGAVDAAPSPNDPNDAQRSPHGDRD